MNFLHKITVLLAMCGFFGQNTDAVISEPQQTAQPTPAVQETYPQMEVEGSCGESCVGCMEACAFSPCGICCLPFVYFCDCICRGICCGKAENT